MSAMKFIGHDPTDIPIFLSTHASPLHAGHQGSARGLSILKGGEGLEVNQICQVVDNILGRIRIR